MDEHEWQPIETIPLDTKVITCHQGRKHSVRIRKCCRLGSPSPNGDELYWLQDNEFDEDADYDPPTHWQPLPKAPE